MNLFWIIIVLIGAGNNFNHSYGILLGDYLILIMVHIIRVIFR